MKDLKQLEDEPQRPEVQKTKLTYTCSFLKKANALLAEKGTDLHELRSLKDQLTQKKHDLERGLAISNKGSTSSISRLLTRAETCASDIDALSVALTPLKKNCDIFYASHAELCAELAPVLAAEETRLKKQCYQATLSRLSARSELVRERLSVGAVDEALQQLGELHAHTAAVVAESRCHALAEYCRSLVAAWRRHVQAQLTTALDAALVQLHYPFISTNTSVSAAPPGPEVQAKLETALRWLCVLSMCGEEPRAAQSGVLGDVPQPSLPIRLLLRPLVKRFIFHFHGDRQTNNLAKPEWYMSHVLQWITDHETFLMKAVAPTLAEHLPECRPRLEFYRGLVVLAVAKLAADLPTVQYDDATFSHTIDESLQLHRQLAALGYGGVPEQPGPLTALCQPPYLARWINMERKYALERLDQMCASETALSVQGDLEEGVTELADGALTLLQAMTERYRQLPEPGQRLQFLELQLELLDDLRVRLLQLLRMERDQPLSEACCALLNTVHHLRVTLAEWGERPALLHLQFFRRRLEVAQQKQRVVEDEEADSAPLSLDQVLERGLNVASVEETEASDDLEGLDTTVFDESVQLLQKTEEDIKQRIVDQVVMEVRARSRPYRKDSWFSMRAPSDFVTPSISATACPLLQVLTQSQEQLRGWLSAPMLAAVWRQLTGQLVEFLYDELVMVNQFSEGGAAQLRHDVSAGLAAVLAEGLQPLTSACALLTLPAGAALLLRHALQTEPAETRRAALQEAGAPALTAEQALLVLQRRTALSLL